MDNFSHPIAALGGTASFPSALVGLVRFAVPSWA